MFSVKIAIGGTRRELPNLMQTAASKAEADIPVQATAAT